MNKFCLLKPPYNQCKYHSGDGRCMAATSTCGMQVKLDDTKKKSEEYVRKPRWYEKYENSYIVQR